MGAARQRPMTADQFLAWEERQELRYEFDGFQAHAMTGGTGAHGAIQANLIGVLYVRLRGKPCRSFGSEFKIRMEHSIRYPDAMVTCTPVGPDDGFLTDPVVVFEILSKSTASKDLGAKSAEYQATPSIRRYVVLEQTHRAARVFQRTPEGWDSEHVDENGILDMPEIGISIPLAEIYEGVTLQSDLAPPRA